jgi:transposase
VPRVIPSTVRIFVCTEPVDMRRSFDGLSLVVEQHMGADPRSGALYVFVNKRKNRLKVLWFDKNGFCILYKRLHHARFELPGSRTIDGRRLASVLRGVETARSRSLRS